MGAVWNIPPEAEKWFDQMLEDSREEMLAQLRIELLAEVNYKLLNLVAYTFRGKSPIVYSTLILLSPFTIASCAYASITSPTNRILSPVSISCLTLHSI